MDPPPTPPRREFLKPQRPFRPKSQTAAGAASSDSATTSSNATPTSSAPHSPPASIVEDAPESSSPQDTSAQHSGVVYYKKSTVLPSQMDPSQPTQILPDIDGLELNENSTPFACLQGHSATMSHDLTREKSNYVAGTSEDCDIIINHGFWEGLGLNPKVLNEPWFILELEPSKSVQGEMKVYIKDISTTGVYIGGKKITGRRLLKYGDAIKGAPEGSKSDLFHYSFKKYTPDTDTIQGDLSTYRIPTKSFARGTYAEVFKATDEKDQALYACKVFNRQSHGWTDQELTGVEFEISLLREMKHDNIVKFQDSCQSNNKTYLILEYLDGVTLYKHYHDNGAYFSEHDARPIFRQVCDGVYYLHSLGIVHRDIKCDNIMVLTTAEGIKVKLIDFGLARRSTNERVLTTFCGTDPYIAPETKVGDESNGYGKAVDVWSLGIVLFRMLTGDYPFRSKRYDQLNTANNPKADAESTEGEHISVELEGAKQDPEITYLAGYRPFYKEDWRPRINKQAVRSSEVKILLEALLDIDASRRCLIHRVLRFDWMRMSPGELKKFDLSGPSQRAANQETIESTAVSLEPSEAQRSRLPKRTWGVLTIVPGSIADAPRRIELWKDKTKLGRDPRCVDLVLGKNTYISAIQCMIHRTEDGMVLVIDLSRNGTFINNMKIEVQKACQLFTGDEIGIVMPPDDGMKPRNLAGDHAPYLKYRAEIIGMPPATPDEIVRRRYFQCDPETLTVAGATPFVGNRLRERSPQRSENDVWALLRELSSEGQEVRKYDLYLKTTSIGRDLGCDLCIHHQYVSREHCVLEWEPEEGKAYLINQSNQGTFVNGEQCSGRFQLRDKDEIRLLNPRGISESVARNEVTTYRIEFVPMDEAAPPTKRLRNKALDLDT